MSKDIIDGEGKQTVESHKKKKKQAETAASLLAGIAAAAAFLLLFFVLQWNFFLCAGLSAALFIALALLIRPQKKIGQMEVSAVSGGEELYQKLEEAREDLDNIGRLMEQVEDETVRAQSRHLHETAGSILAYLEKHPNKIKLARRFIDYYQDTASSLLAKYVELEDSGLDTADAAGLKKKTGQALAALNQAFDGQFQRLMSNELMDMDAEIRVLEQTIKMEGPL